MAFAAVLVALQLDAVSSTTALDALVERDPDSPSLRFSAALLAHRARPRSLSSRTSASF